MDTDLLAYIEARDREQITRRVPALGRIERPPPGEVSIRADDGRQVRVYSHHAELAARPDMQPGALSWACFEAGGILLESTAWQPDLLIDGWFRCFVDLGHWERWEDEGERMSRRQREFEAATARGRW